MEERFRLYPECEKNIVVVGHKGCGKTSLIAAFASESPADVDETASKEIRKVINFGREKVQVVLLEEEADPHYSFVKRLDYARTSVALVCFAFNDAKSIRSVPLWIDEVRLFCTSAVLAVVGCKLDQKHKTTVSAMEWMHLEKAIVPYRYLECSSKTGEGVSHLVRVVGVALCDQQNYI